jgi:hypothetical protein
LVEARRPDSSELRIAPAPAPWDDNLHRAKRGRLLRGTLSIRVALTAMIAVGALAILSAPGGFGDVKTASVRGVSTAPRNPNAVVETWLEAVRTSHWPKACRLVTEDARHGFSFNFVVLPSFRRTRRCGAVAREAQTTIHPDAFVGKQLSRADVRRRLDDVPSQSCAGGVPRTAGVRWRIPGERNVGLQRLCRINRHWKLDRAVYLRSIDD